MRLAAFVQARMSSARFPGKVLAPFRGRPLVDHVVDAVARALPGTRPCVVTSLEPSDDPLVAYLERRGVDVFRGPLDDVLGRFCRALDEVRPDAEWALRVCADSPLLSPDVIARVLEAVVPDADLVTTTHVRTFPKGQNVEIVRAEVLRRLDLLPEVTAEDREHVTRFVHRNPAGFRIVNVTSGNPVLSEESHVVDTVDDLRRLEEGA
jgi:spore coat polysaccharide biosynthesis protein SpsF